MSPQVREKHLINLTVGHWVIMITALLPDFSKLEITNRRNYFFLDNLQ